MKIKLAFLTALVLLGFSARTSLAADFTNLIDGELSASTNQNNFNLTGVSLDAQDASRSIKVRCYKKGPGDSIFTQFDTDQDLIPGGNAYSCAVTSSLLNVEGSYSFKTIASVTDPSYQELESSTITVNYNTSGPETPNSYSKEKLNSCDYKIRFKTANDGKTVKVQLFRSDTFAISVGSSSVAGSINIGPNTEGEIVNSVPTCGKDYYFVIRAVDASDNASGTVGDSFTTVTTVGSTTITSSTPGTNGTGAIALNGTSTQVIAETGINADNATGSSEIDGSNANPTPTVLGSSTDTNKGISKWIQAFVAFVFIVFAYKILKSKKSK